MIDPSRVFRPHNENSFRELALEVFRLQSANCKVYADFIRFLGVDPAGIDELSAIPFLPVEFFKTHGVLLAGKTAEVTFTSSGTTGSVQSRHLVADKRVYEQSYRSAFSGFYGPVSEFVLLALLPSYQEREGSSLIYMVDDLLAQAAPGSGYVLENPAALQRQLVRLSGEDKQVLLIGVTYALLDLVENYPVHFPGLTVMETGGMKGRRKEMIREELHERLRAGFGVPQVHSEYGMTELLSQAYSKGEGKFSCPPWMKVLTRDPNDPFSPCDYGQTGGINIIDLANFNSCAFIATQDLGKIYPGGSFEVLGRFDNSDVRGCNLLVQ